MSDIFDQLKECLKIVVADEGQVFYCNEDRSVKTGKKFSVTLFWKEPGKESVIIDHDDHIIWNA